MTDEQLLNAKRKIKKQKALIDKLSESCVKIQKATPYSDYGKELLIDMCLIHKGNLVGDLAEAQLSIRESLEEVEKMKADI